MKNKIALSIDIEDWYHSRHVTSLQIDPNRDIIEFREKYDKGYSFLDRPIDVILEELEQRSIKATFFIVADLIADNRKLFARIVDAGHEIACHELHHIEYVGDGEAEERRLFRENVSKSKALLEDLCGGEVVGFRAPSARYRTWMTRELTDLGFRYDSSISVNSLYNKTDGSLHELSSAPVALDPEKLAPSSAGRLLEIPWPYYEIAGFKIPAAGGPVLRFFGGRVIRAGLRQSLKRGDTVFYIHPHDISEEPLPEIIASSRRRFWVNRGNVAYKRFQFILNNFAGRFCTCKEVYLRNSKEI